MRNLYLIKLTKSSIIIALALLISTQPIKAQNFLNENDGKAQIMILGTFHFKDKGLDSYKPQYNIDILSEEKQAEVKKIIKLLESYEPTKIAVEVKTNRQAYLDSLYNEYLAGTFALPSNEIYQFGFRLARHLSHEKVYAIDVKGRSYFVDLTQEEYDARVQKLKNTNLLHRDWNTRYKKLYTYGDSLKMSHSLREHLLYLNSEERLRKGHGHYLVDTFKFSAGDDYLGPDMATRWYNRNLRIFSNLQRITKTQNEKILLIIGAGHVPIIRHAVESSPEYQLVEVSEYLQIR